MKILIIHTAYRFSGGEDCVVEAEKHLLETNGHEIFYLSFKNPANPIKSSWLFFASIFNPASFFRVRKTIQVFKPDVLHVHNWHFAASPAVFIAARTQKTPVVYTLHNYRLLCPSGTLFHNGHVFLNSLQQSFPWLAIKKKVYRSSYFQTFWLAFVIWFHKIIGTWRNIDKYITLTQFGKELFVNSDLLIKPEQISVKPNFTEAVNVSKQSRTNAFLFVGRLSEEKGIDCLLNAFRQNGLELLIGGDGPLSEKVRKISIQYPNIQYLGSLSKSQVRVHMQTCTALISTSICYETFGLVIIEAFALGTPTIVSHIGAASAIVTHSYNGFHFEPGNVEELNCMVNKWKNLSENTKETIRQDARKTYESLYTPIKNSNQLITIYQSVLDR